MEELTVFTNALNETTNNLANVTLEDLQAKHRRERKELQAKVQDLKKKAPKSDKKKRKDALEEIAKLEANLDTKQKMELKACEQTSAMKNGEDSSTDIKELKTSEDVEVNSETEISAADAEGNGDFVHGYAKIPQRVSKAQKRRDKKSLEARQREQEIKAAAEDAMYAPKAVELRKILSKLKKRHLALQNIPSDGDCLYNAIRHQLLEQGLGQHSVKSLRYETANYIHANKEILHPYMTQPDTGDLLDDDDFEKYCDDVRNTPAWGGQIELKALSSILKVPIEVVQADGSPTIQGLDEFGGSPLVITYHRHMYSLGEHYNSTVPYTENGSEEENIESL